MVRLITVEASLARPGWRAGGPLITWTYTKNCGHAASRHITWQQPCNCWWITMDDQPKKSRCKECWFTMVHHGGSTKKPPAGRAGSSSPRNWEVQPAGGSERLAVKGVSRASLCSYGGGQELQLECNQMIQMVVDAHHILGYLSWSFLLGHIDTHHIPITLSVECHEHPGADEHV